MKNFGTRSTIFAGLCGTTLMLAGIGCGSSSTTGTGTGGAAGTSSTGGGGNGGASGGAAGTAAVALAYNFDSSTQGFKIQTYVDTSQYKNLGALGVDAAIPANYPALSFNSTEGKPNPGSLQIVADFTDYQQYVEALVSESPAKDLSGLKIRANVQATTAFYGGAYIYAKTGPQYIYGAATGMAVGAGTWTSLILDLSTVTATGIDASFAPMMVEEIGVHFYSDGPPTDGGAFASGSYTLLIDSVTAAQ